MNQKKLKNHYFYLGPKYTEAIHAFHEAVAKLDKKLYRGYLVRIPCDEYVAVKPEKDKKKKLASPKHQELRLKKLAFNNAERHRMEDWLIKYHEITLSYATNDYQRTSGGQQPPPGYFSDTVRMTHLYKQYEEPVKNQLQGLYPTDARPTAENAMRGVKRWYKLSHTNLCKLRDQLYEDKRKLEQNDKGVKPRIKFRRSEEGIPVFDGTYIWGGLLWDTDKLYNYCKLKKYNYYWIDNAYIIPYMLNATEVSGEKGKKNIARHQFGLYKIIKNGFHISKLIDRPGDRFVKLEKEFGHTNWQMANKKKIIKEEIIHKRKPKYILVCPPSKDYEKVFGYENWLEKTLKEIKKHTDIKIKIRLKKIRKTIPLKDDLEYAHCTVAPASGVSIESILEGVPTFCSDFSPAAPVGNLDLSKINDPWFPTQEEIIKWLHHLAYCQFTLKEIEDGTAWNILNNIK